MSDDFSLTSAQVNQFRKDGVIGPFDLYDSSFIKKEYRTLRSELFDREYAAYNLPHTSLLSGYDRHLDIDFFSKHIMKKEIVEKVKCILGPDILCWRSELFPKYPGDEGTDWHQADTFAHASGAPQVVWPEELNFGGSITVWTSVTEADEENGCLRFIPGTHEEMFYDESKDMKYTPDNVNLIKKNGINRGFFGYDYRNLQIDPSFEPDESKAISVVMKPGQFVIFWSTLMHASLPNISLNRTRLGFTARYVPTCVRIYPNANEINEYGSKVSLEKYGTVIVSGKDEFRHNRVVSKNMRGLRFSS